MLNGCRGEFWYKIRTTAFIPVLSIHVVGLNLIKLINSFTRGKTGTNARHRSPVPV
jgi:hypothetical protein